MILAANAWDSYLVSRAQNVVSETFAMGKWEEFPYRTITPEWPLHRSGHLRWTPLGCLPSMEWEWGRYRMTHVSVLDEI